MERGALEQATQAFLDSLRAVHARRFPGQPTRVPRFEDLNVLDRGMMMKAVGSAIQAAGAYVPDLKPEANQKA